MIQFCRKAIVEPLRTLFLSFLEDGVYPNNWKKSIFVQLHKKEKKYKPISLLPAFSQVFERILFNSLFNFFLENKLLPKCQFTKFHFLQRDFCIPQFLSLTHKIYKSFDCNSSANARGSVSRYFKSL